MFRKVLIANRGEIAVRIAATLQQMGIEVAAVYAKGDENAVHLAYADEAHPLPLDPALPAYLNQQAILAIAQHCQAEAIHPGYGFLSENPEFAKACQRADVVFIGPSPDALQKMGDKLYAKQLAQRCAVPVIPGTNPEGAFNPEKLKTEARKIGYPLVIKGVAGGGGKGVRVLESEGEFDASLQAVQREAEHAFGDNRVFIEKYLDRPRHIEIQIFGDKHGSLIHCFERECSIQRRYQKIIEESPSPSLSSELRNRLAQAALKIAKAAGYTNAGTVEFLVDREKFFFLEMNTRLQVEHPVTEMIVQKDLVRLQIEIAAGEKLSLLQENLNPAGHAIECRVYAENPRQNFAPCTGIVEKYSPPAGPNIRVDAGIREGSVITIDYDPMLAKLIVWGESRHESLTRMDWALNHFVLLGVQTNLQYLQKLINHPEFVKGHLHTRFIEEHAGKLQEISPAPPEAFLASALVSQSSTDQASTQQNFNQTPEKESPWTRLGKWRGF